MNTNAYLYQIDWETLGLWYTGKNGTKANRLNRVYGREGAIILYHGQVEDGNKMIPDGRNFLDNSDNFLPMQRAHYVEYPAWVRGAALLSEGVGEWNNSQITLEQRIDETNRDAFKDRCGLGKIKQPLYINFDQPEYLAITKGLKRIGTSALKAKEIRMQFDLADDAWRLVTFYVGDLYANTNKTYAEAWVRLCDVDGRVLCSTLLKEAQKCAYVTFAVQGSFQLWMDANGYPGVALSAVYFDEIVHQPSIGTADVQAALLDTQRIRLTWTNLGDASYTNVYRREKGENCFALVGTAEPGETSFTDDTTLVARNYEYVLASGTKREYPADRAWDYYGYAMTGSPQYEHGMDVVSFNVPDAEAFTACATAPYEATMLNALENNLTAMVGEAFQAKVRLAKMSSGQPLAGEMIRFALSGEGVFRSMDGVPVPNMRTELGTVVTDAAGVAVFSWAQPYAGDYTLTATLDERPDPADRMHGLVASFATMDLSVQAPVTADVPALMTITDAVKPGNAFQITGNFLQKDEASRIAYAPANGEERRPFCEAIPGVKYIAPANIVMQDTTFGTNLMGVFPAEAQPGVYDVWVRNCVGWSAAITMNAARPLFINETGSYPGMPIELVGRNLLGSEFLLADHTLVKLLRVDGEGEAVVPINTGVKWSAGETFVKEDIQRSNPCRIEFTVPDISPGLYDVYVSNMGEGHFHRMNGEQQLRIDVRKTPRWDTAVFGEAAHIGNDPLDLKVGWAQEFCYDRVIAVPEEYRCDVPRYAVWGDDEKIKRATTWLRDTIKGLSAQGGGVVYFPKGCYFFTPKVWMQDNVILVGESRTETKVHMQFPADWEMCYEEESSFLRADGNQYIGIARMTVIVEDKVRESMPDRTVNWMRSTNMFVSEVNFDLVWEDAFTMANDGKHRGLGLYNGSHLVYQHVKSRNLNTALNMPYTLKYSMIRDVEIRSPGALCFMGQKYNFVENTCFINGGNTHSHGWSGRGCAYVAHNYIQDVGKQFANPQTDGEVMLFEPPGSRGAVGRILAADENSFTIATERGDFISEACRGRYDHCALFVCEGRGAGQIRYFQPIPVAAKDGVVYGNSYLLMPWEQPWQVVPDHTSSFYIFEPMHNITVWHNQAIRCAKSLMFYGQCFDGVMIGNRLINTEGLQLFSCTRPVGDCTTGFCRLEGNVIDGVSTGTGNGGIEVFSHASGPMRGIMQFGHTIRGNVVRDIRNFGGWTGHTEHTKFNAGVTLATVRDGGQMKDTGYIRGIIVEGNTLDNCEYGIRADHGIYGVMDKDNIYRKIGVHGDVPPNAKSPKGMGETNVTLLEAMEFHTC